MSVLLAAALVAGAVYAHPEMLVETDWVAAHGADPAVRIVDMRRGGFETGHIPGAVYLQPDSIRNAKNPPTFLPTPEEFQRAMVSLGIGDDTRVVVYDERGGIYAARLWWLLTYFGHSNVALVNGGWVKWTAEHRPGTAEDARLPASVRFTPKPQPQWIATATDVVAAIDTPGIRIVDARTAGEIAGQTMGNVKRGGFIPSSTPVYWEDLLDPVAKTFRSADDIKALYESRGVLPSHQVIAYCLVGMRASVDLFALHLVGYERLRNYYGAWDEWGNRDDLPIGTK